MRHDIRSAGEAEQGVEDAGVAEVDPWRAHLTLADVVEPRLELPDHEDRGEQVKVSPDRRVGDAEDAPELRAVPDLPVPVREHGAGAAERRRRDGAPEFREIPRQERADEPVSPATARGLRPGEVRAREPAAEPEPFQIVRFVEAEAIKFVERDTSGERLGGLTQKFGRRAPQHEEAGRRAGTVREDAKELEDVEQTVDLIQNHETLERP